MRYLKLLFFLLLPGCAILRIDPMNPLIRSDYIRSEDQEKEIISRASVGWTEDGRIRVLKVSGTPYERGFQQGFLLRKEIQDNFNYMFSQAMKKFRSEELFAEAYERQRPFIPEEYIEEMHGIAHGAKVPLKLIHYIHALPEMTEWGGAKRLRGVIKQMMNGELATSCSNICAQKETTADNSMYTVRVLDWGLQKVSKLHEYPLITINFPDKGIPSANIGWVGFLGAVSGMNAAGITLGEMGYGNPANETLSGKPMPFLLRDVLTYASNLGEVRKILKESPGTNSFVFMMSDGKSGEGEMYVKDLDRFVVFKPGTEVHDGDQDLPAINNVTYGGHDNKMISELISANRGKLTPEMFMDQIIPKIAMKSNFQNVIYDPANLRFWVANAGSPTDRAAEEPYTFFDLKAALK